MHSNRHKGLSSSIPSAADDAHHDCVSDPLLPLTPEELDKAEKEVRRWKLKMRIPDTYRVLLDEFFEHHY